MSPDSIHRDWDTACDAHASSSLFNANKHIHPARYFD
jgi:hypothetical protein